MVEIRYWVQDFEDEYRIAELRRGQLEKLLMSQPQVLPEWTKPLPPSACVAALQIGDLDFFLIGDVTREDLDRYAKQLEPDSRVLQIASLMDVTLRELLTAKLCHFKLVSPTEIVLASDNCMAAFLDEMGETKGEVGRFTLSLDGIGANGKRFSNPGKQLNEALENFFGAWGCRHFEQRQQRWVLSSTFEFEFDGFHEVQTTLSWPALSGLFLNGSLRSWSTWWATVCHILREYPGFVALNWLGPDFRWELSFNKQGEATSRFLETVGQRHLHRILIKVRHPLLAMVDPVEVRQGFLGHEKFIAELNDSANRIAMLRGRDDFFLRDRLRFDGDIDEPFSIAIEHSRLSYIEFELNRRLIRVQSPLPCCIYVFGSRLTSDLSKNIRVPQEIVDRVYQVCAPYAQEALLSFCREAPGDSLQVHFWEFLTRPRPKSRTDWTMDRRSVDILEEFALVGHHGCEPKSMKAVREFWAGRVILSAYSSDQIPDHLQHIPWLDATPHTKSMLELWFSDSLVLQY